MTDFLVDSKKITDEVRVGSLMDEKNFALCPLREWFSYYTHEAAIFHGNEVAMAGGWQRRWVCWLFGRYCVTVYLNLPKTQETIQSKVRGFTR